MYQTKTAYDRPDPTVRDNRAVEYDLFARTTRRLTSAWADREADPNALVQALHDNRALWQAMAVDVAGPGNALPKALRAQLFYLYEFTVGHTRKILDEAGSAGVLIDINTAVMKGLRGVGAT